MGWQTCRSSDLLRRRHYTFVDPHRVGAPFPTTTKDSVATVALEVKRAQEWSVDRHSLGSDAPHAHCLLAVAGLGRWCRQGSVFRVGVFPEVSRIAPAAQCCGLVAHQSHPRVPVLHWAHSELPGRANRPREQVASGLTAHGVWLMLRGSVEMTVMATCSCHVGQGGQATFRDTVLPTGQS